MRRSDLGHAFVISVVLLITQFSSPSAAGADGSVSFVSRTDLAFGSSLFAVGDFNGDRNEDIAIAKTTTAAILLGNGEGTFQPTPDFPIPQAGPFGATVAISTGDFNDDGKLDLAAIAVDGGPTRSTLSTLLGNGNGTFQPAIIVIGGISSSAGFSLAVGDFDRDGRQDIVVRESGGLRILLGNGDGTFSPRQTVLIPGPSTRPLLVGDFNQDQREDIVNSSVILLGAGDGSFQPPRSINAGGLVFTASADFNGDGRLDLAGFGGNDAGVLYGNGDGTFQIPQLFATGGLRVDWVSTGDFNRDSRMDLAAANADSDDVSILLRTGNGTFETSYAFGAGDTPGMITIADLNGDGRQDLLVSNPSASSISLVFGFGDGTLRSDRSFPVGEARVALDALTAGDFNADGITDLAATQRQGLVSVRLGNGDGTFGPAQHYLSHAFVWDIATGDFDRDGRQDLVVANSGSAGPEAPVVSIFKGNGDGTFQPAQDVGPVRRAWSVAIADFNTDGIQDLAVSYGDPAGVLLLFGNGDGSFSVEQDELIEPADSAVLVEVGDFNGDRLQDFTVVGRNQPGSSFVSVWMNIGGGDFRKLPSTLFSNPPNTFSSNALLVTDINGDRRLDIAVANRAFFDSDLVPVASIFIGNGNGTFQSPRDVESENRGESLAAADFDGDGRQDLAIGNFRVADGSLISSAPMISIMLGKGDGTFKPAQDFPSRELQSLAAGDFNRDGRPDLATPFMSVMLNDTGGGQGAEIVNNLVRLDSFRTSTGHSTSPQAPAGTLIIQSTFTNISRSTLCNPFFKIVELSGGNQLQGVWVQPGPQIQGAGGQLISHPPVIFEAGNSVTFEFVVGLQTRNAFTFFVNMWGVVQSRTDPCL